jgi:hypothetical protein
MCKIMLLQFVRHNYEITKYIVSKAGFCLRLEIKSEE